MVCLLEKHPNQAIVEAGGVGYDVTIPVSTYTHLPEPGAEVKLRIHTHVREDALALFGFLTQDEKAIFEKLIGVSGIGPTLAVKILSGSRRAAISSMPFGAARSTGSCASRASARRPPSAWCSSSATSCRPFPARSRPSLRRRGALAHRPGCALRAAQSRLRPPASRSCGAQGQSFRRDRGANAEFEPLFRRALELVR